ncbi:MAG: YjbQ family protein [Candidatus Eisenbacteria bacterium]|nr:YjbQ family protein [Candidatus Eisenbacteria bacterium]
MTLTLEVQTSSRIQTLDITREVASAIPEGASGLCVVYTPHTTTAIGINEGADPDVKRDIESNLARLFPERGDYRHAEGNSDAHLKSVLIGPSETILVDEGRLVLGRWQSVYFCEFDGPRTRRVLVRFIAG